MIEGQYVDRGFLPQREIDDGGVDEEEDVDCVDDDDDGGGERALPL